MTESIITDKDKSEIEDKLDIDKEEKEESISKTLNKTLPNTTSYSGSRQRLYNYAIYGLI